MADTRDRMELQQMLQRRLAEAKGHRSEYDPKVTKWHQQYIGYRDPLPEGQTGANVHVPRTYEEIDTLRARICKSLLGARPYIDFLPSGTSTEEIAANDAKAKLAAALVDMQLERNQFPVTLYKFVTSVLTAPIGVLSVGWRLEKAEVRRRVWDDSVNTSVDRVSEEIIWDDNEVRNVDFSDFWWDPRGTDLDSCRYVFHRTYATRKEIEARLALIERAGAGQIYEIDWDKLRGVSTEDAERLTALGTQMAPLRSLGDRLSAEDGLYEVLDYWTDDNHAILVGGELAHYGDNPYWRHRKKPFVVGVFDPLPGEFAGLNAVQILEHLQDELNTSHNQRIDYVSMLVKRMWRRDPTSELDDSQLVWRANGVIEARKDEIEALNPGPDFTGTSMAHEGLLKVDMENALGVPPAERGVTSAGHQTATEIVTQSSNAGIRFDVRIMLFEAMGLKRLAYLMDCNNQQFIDKERMVRLPNAEGIDAWQLVRPGQLVGEFDYRPAGSSVDPAANKDMRRQQLMQLQEAVRDNPYVDQYELTKMIVQSFDIKNVEKIMVAKPEIAPPGMVPGAPPPGAEAQTLAGMAAALAGQTGQPPIHGGSPQ